MSYVDFAQTDHQRKVAELLDQGYGPSDIAKQLDKADSNIRKIKRKIKRLAALKGYAPDCDLSKPVPEGYKIKGTSTLYDEDGKPKLQWVKTTQDAERQLELMQEAIASLCEDLPKLTKSKPNQESYRSDCMAVYPLGDPHIGVLAWGEETWQDWDLRIAEEKFCAVFDRLVRTAQLL
jgi:hypothetical protein